MALYILTTPLLSCEAQCCSGRQVPFEGSPISTPPKCGSRNSTCGNTSLHRSPVPMRPAHIPIPIPMIHPVYLPDAKEMPTDPTHPCNKTAQINVKEIQHRPRQIHAYMPIPLTKSSAPSTATSNSPTRVFKCRFSSLNNPTVSHATLASCPLQFEHPAVSSPDSPAIPFKIFWNALICKPGFCLGVALAEPGGFLDATDTASGVPSPCGPASGTVRPAGGDCGICGITGLRHREKTLSLSSLASPSLSSSSSHDAPPSAPPLR